MTVPVKRQVGIPPVESLPLQDTEFKPLKKDPNRIHSLTDISVTKWNRDQGKKMDAYSIGIGWAHLKSYNNHSGSLYGATTSQ